jgi:hypothetical protein
LQGGGIVIGEATEADVVVLEPGENGSGGRFGFHGEVDGWGVDVES